MENIIKVITDVNSAINNFIWGPVMLILLVGVGIYFSIRCGFIQVTKFGTVMKSTIGTMFHKKERTKGTITPFQAMSTALAGTIGTGNIVGVATAIVAGGPGAVFWMWVSAIFGMVTKYAEVLLAVKFREKDSSGKYIGGPMYYIQNGLGARWLGMIFAFFCVFASFGIGNMTQSNSISTSMASTFGIPTIVTGVLVAICVGFAVIGGMSRIVKITEKVVPFMAIFYIFATVTILFINRSSIIPAFETIFTDAFNFQAGVAGVMGYFISKGMRYGFARGVFSNEAGLGSAPIAHASADTDSPVKQGLWGIFEVFADTLVMCTLTALVIITSGLWTTGLDGADLTNAAFTSSLGTWGGIALSISLLFFAMSTIMGWSVYGERSLYYLTKKPWITVLFKIVFIGLIVVGATMELELVWSISDTLNGLMAIPNLIGLVGLSGIVIATTKEYFKKDKLK